jgi:hypothetical protein
MANTIGWGEGSLNNTIGWGQGAANNSISWGKSHAEDESWSGDTNLFGLTVLQVNFRDRVIADGGTVESIQCVEL